MTTRSKQIEAERAGAPGRDHRRDHRRDHGRDHGREHGRDHGGDLERAIDRWGGAPCDWIDLSTGINPCAYPAPAIPPESWSRLPSARAERALIEAARAYYGVPDAAALVATPGAQAAIQLAPTLRGPGAVAIVSPTYNEHAAAFAAAGWRVRSVSDPSEAGADALVVVNPNNPDGRRFAPDALAARAADGRFTLIDESFADPTPEASAVPWTGGEGLLVLKSFGKFFGLAGLRLGFVIGSARDIEGIGDRLGPWAVSGPALEIGRAALADAAWIAETRARLARDGARLDAWSAAMGWGMVGGADLFRLVDTPDAAAAQGRLAEARIWTRAFPYSGTWLRIGLPQPDAWPRLEALVP